MTDVLKRKKATRNLALALPLLALLGACTNSGGIDDAFTTASIGRLNIEAPGPHISNYSIARSAPVSEALVKPAAFGAKIVQVSQIRFSNGLSQKIVLEGKPGQSGENWMRVSISDGRKTGGRPDVLIVDKPTSRSVAKQLRAHFPRRHMIISNVSHSNSYGVFGTAHAKGAANAGCHYAWQMMHPRKLRGNLAWPSMSSKPKVMLVETRLCQKGLSVDGFLGFMNSLQLDVPSDVLSARAATDWASAAPVDPISASPDLVGAGAPSTSLIASRALPPAVEPLKPLPPVRRAAPSVRQKPIARTVKPVSVSKPLPQAVKPKQVAQKESAKVPLTPTNDPLRESNRISVADASKFPTVPLPQ